MENMGHRLLCYFVTLSSPLFKATNVELLKIQWIFLRGGGVKCRQCKQLPKDQKFFYSNSCLLFAVKSLQNYLIHTSRLVPLTSPYFPSSLANVLNTNKGDDFDKFVSKNRFSALEEKAKEEITEVKQVFHKGQSKITDMKEK